MNLTQQAGNLIDWVTPHQVATRYPENYRMPELKTVAQWIAESSSGCIVSLAGMGRGTFLKFFCQHPNLVTTYLHIEANNLALISVDLSLLVDKSLSTFYRTILRAFFVASHQFTDVIKHETVKLYRKNEKSQDAFLSQSDLIELLTLFAEHNVRVVCVFDRFDVFLDKISSEIVNTLRGIRDSFKGTLCYIINLHQEIPYLPDPNVIGLLTSIIDTRICWLGALSKEDTFYQLKKRLQIENPSPELLTQLWFLTGGVPALIPIVCNWWRAYGSELESTDLWTDSILKLHSTQQRFDELWRGLTQDEQFVLQELQNAHARLETNIVSIGEEKAHAVLQRDEERHRDVLAQLRKKGLCYFAKDHYHIFSSLFVRYMKQLKVLGRGRVWFNGETNEFYQGHTLLESLTPLERAILRFLFEFPRERHTYSEIIEGAWSEEIQKEGVSTETLYQHIRGLRRKIEPNSSYPAHIVNWRGQPEGGYQFFPEGKPQ